MIENTKCSVCQCEKCSKCVVCGVQLCYIDERGNKTMLPRYNCFGDEVCTNCYPKYKESKRG